jgi:chemotaxis protein CheX
MVEKELETFVAGTTNYFAQSAQQPAVVGSPYLIEQDASIAKDYTGIIGISGKRKGMVYFTAPTGMLRVLLMAIGESEVTHDNMCDLVGEVANTISGNARRDFGPEFMISVPLVVAGEPERIVRPKKTRSFVIPIHWRNYDAQLVVCLQ